MIIRGILKRLGVAGENSQVQITDSVREGQRIEPYGVTSKPTLGNQACIIYIGSDKGNGIHFLTGDEREKPKLQEGEVAVYFDKDNYVKLGTETTEIKRATMTMTISKEGKLNIKNGDKNLFTILEELINTIATHKTPTIYGPQVTPEGIQMKTILDTKLKEVLE